MIKYFNLVLVRKVLTPVQIDLVYWLFILKSWMLIWKWEESCSIYFLVVLSLKSFYLSIPLACVWWTIVHCSMRCTQGGEESYVTLYPVKLITQATYSSDCGLSLMLTNSKETRDKRWDRFWFNYGLPKIKLLKFKQKWPISSKWFGNNYC